MSTDKPDESYENFDEFWAHYLAEHSDPTNRLLHAVGTTAAIATVAAAIIKRKPKLLALAPLVGYGPSWIGHFLIEKNRPASFGNPLWSLRGDLKMLKLMINDELDEEVLRLIAEGKSSPKMLADLASAAE
ncbi:MAG: Mpo1-like protein [Persicimonas sp.]